MAHKLPFVDQVNVSARPPDRRLIDNCTVGQAAHFQFAIFGREPQTAFDQVERISAEFVEPPAAQDIEPVAHSGGERLKLVGTSDQLCSNACLLGADLEQQLQ